MKLKFWRTQIERLAKGTVSPEVLAPLANNFATCAVGERHGFPLTDDYTRTEQEQDIGGKFDGDLILSRNYAKIRRLLRKIESLK